MKVILCEDVDNLGDMGETVNVARGYARNFLLPRKLAVAAESASAQQIEHEMRIISKREERRREELAGVAKSLADVRLDFTAKSGAEGKLFGSITTLHIAEKLTEIGHPVNRRKITLSEPIKTAGEHDVTVRLTAGIEATIKVVVTAEVSEEAKVEAEAPASEEATTEESAAEETGSEDEAAAPQDEEAAVASPSEASAESAD